MSRTGVHTQGVWLYSLRSYPLRHTLSYEEVLSCSATDLGLGGLQVSVLRTSSHLFPSLQGKAWYRSISMLSAVRFDSQLCLGCPQTALTIQSFHCPHALSEKTSSERPQSPLGSCSLSSGTDLGSSCPLIGKYQPGAKTSQTSLCPPPIPYFVFLSKLARNRLSHQKLTK